MNCITWLTSDGNQMLLKSHASYDLDSDATYLIAGGLGGLGRSAARWMARRGAKNLMLLSRTGPRVPAALDLISDLQSLGVRVEAPQCDVSSHRALSQTLSQYASMPPIKGCVQATMVLRDSIYNNMCFEDWKTAVNSKVQSSYNLHELLPKQMSFFIFLSSVAGVVGSPGQANYAAGNTYQAALAKHRRAIGLKATAIHLGWMDEVGIVAENERYTRGKEAAADLAAISQKEFLALLEVYCDPHLESSEARYSKVAEPIIGLVTAADLRARGIDPPVWTERPMFAALPQRISPEVGDGWSTETEVPGIRGYASDFLSVMSDADATSVVIDGLLQRLSRAVSMDVKNIDVSKPLHVYGVDSLLAVELRNWFAKVWKSDIAVFDITGQSSIADIGQLAMQRSQLRPAKNT